MEIVILGFVVGFLVGLTGMGGGALMTPALIFMGIPARIAVGSDLLYSAITRLAASTLHFKRGNIDVKLVLFLLIGSIPGSFTAGVIINTIRESYGLAILDFYLTKILGITLVITAVIAICRAFMKKEGREFSKKTLFFVGFAVGMIVQFTSVGSGILVTLFLLLFTKMYPRNIVGTDVLYGFILSSFSALIHFLMGNVDFTLVSLLAIGSIPGTYLGVYFNSKVNEKFLRNVLALVIFSMGIILLI